MGALSLITMVNEYDSRCTFCTRSVLSSRDFCFQVLLDLRGNGSVAKPLRKQNATIMAAGDLKDPVLTTEWTVSVFGGRSYRCFGVPSNQDSAPSSLMTNEGQFAVLFLLASAHHLAEASLDHDLPIVPDKSSGGFLLKEEISKVFYPFIIGKKSAQKQLIERETGTTLKIPGRGQSSEIVGTDSIMLACLL